MKRAWPLRASLFVGTFTLLSFSGCSTLQSLNPFAGQGEEQVAPAEPTQNPAVPAENPVQADNTSSIEVMWQVPGEPVEEYHLYYGIDPQHLDNHIEVPVSELQKIDHPKHGPVFRYELKGVPANRAIYISMRAANKGKLSDPSPTIKIEPGQKTSGSGD
jgi:hypothetical protein